MFVIWLGAFTSLAVAMFSGYLPQLTSAGSAAGALASMATRSLPWLPSDADVRWHVFATVFCVLALAPISAYVSWTNFR